MLLSNTRSLYKPFMLGLAVLLIILLSACGGKNDGKSGAKNIVATYEGGTVTEKEFNSYIGARKLLDQSYMYLEMMPDFQTMVLNQYIAENILSSEASKDVDKASKEQAKTAAKNMEDSLDADAEQKTSILAFMKESDIDFGDLEQYVHTQYNLQSVLTSKFTEDEMKVKYDENLKADENAYLQATVRHVLVALKDATTGAEIRTKDEALTRANEAYEKLKSTGDWDKLALEYSDDGNKDSGGIYENVDVNTWVESFKNAAINQPLNEIGKPVETEYGYHVVVVESRSNKEFAAVKDSVNSELINEYFLNFIEVEVPKLIIGEVNLPEPEPTEAPEGTAAPDATTAPGATDAPSPSPAATTAP